MRFFFAVAGCVIALASLGCGRARVTSTTSDASPVASGSIPATTDGATLYASLCAICHAPDATGYRADNAPSLVNPTFLASASDDFLRRSIADGRPGTSMAAYGVNHGGPLAPDAIGRIVGWLRTHGGPYTPPLAHPAGDASRGAPIYAANCERCHGNATTRVNAVHLANPRFLEIANDPFLTFAIAEGRPGTPMPSWKTTLTSEQIADVVAHVRAFNKPPPEASLPPPTGDEPLVLNPGAANPKFTPRSTPCLKDNPCAPDDRFVSAEQVNEALKEKKRLVIIDARPQSEWMHVHIPGAVSIPYFELKRLERVPNDGTWVIAYCACPHHLSGNVVDALRTRGVKRAAILDEGILEWQRRGYPVVTAPGTEAPPKELAPADSLAK